MKIRVITDTWTLNQKFFDEFLGFHNEMEQVWFSWQFNSKKEKVFFKKNNKHKSIKSLSKQNKIELNQKMHFFLNMWSTGQTQLNPPDLLDLINSNWSFCQGKHPKKKVHQHFNLSSKHIEPIKISKQLNKDCFLKSTQL